MFLENRFSIKFYSSLDHFVCLDDLSLIHETNLALSSIIMNKLCTVLLQYEISCTQNSVRYIYKVFALYFTDCSSCRLVHRVNRKKFILADISRFHIIKIPIL